jgi:xanthosine utilization system XapX-like protein
MKQKESLEFLSIARSTIYNHTLENVRLNNVEKEEVRNFMFNEASDYQIISLLVEEKFPNEKYNAISENKVWDKFKRQITKNYNVLSESITKDILEDIIFEIGPVSELGMSSMKPLMEFQKQNVFLNEVDPSGAEKRIARVQDEEIARREAARKAAEIARQKQIDDLPNAKQRIEALPTPQPKPQSTGVMSKIGQGVSKANTLLKQGLTKIGDISGASGIGAKIGASPAMAGLGVLGIASLLGYGAYKTYQRFFSKAAKACSKFSGGQKSQCMKNFKINAMKAQIADLSKGSAACGQSSDPAKCKLLANKRMQKIKDQIAKLSIAT